MFHRVCTFANAWLSIVFKGGGEERGKISKALIMDNSRGCPTIVLAIKIATTARNSAIKAEALVTSLHFATDNVFIVEIVEQAVHYFEETSSVAIAIDNSTATQQI